MAIQNSINLTATGMISADGAGVFSGRTITAGTGISMANGDGTGGNPTVSLVVPVVETNGGTGQTTYTTGDILYASGVNTLSKLAVGSNGEVLKLAGGVPTWSADAGGQVDSVSGTTNRITISGTAADPIVDIAATYVGQSTITTLGTVSTGTWEGTTIAVDQGGTGQTSYTNGQLLIGNTTGNTLAKATLTAGTGISITNGTGSITIDADNNGDVTAAANITNNRIVRGDGGAKGIQESVITLSDAGALTGNGDNDGGNINHSLKNINNTAGSQVNLQLSVAGSSAGDAWHRWQISGVREYSMGVDNDDSDALVITNASTLNGSNFWKMTSAGEITKPSQPAFLSYQNSSAANVTGDGTAYTLGSSTALTEAFDQGGDITTGGTFTAPVTGRYYLGSNFLLQSLVNGTNVLNSRINTSNATYNLNNDNDCFTGNNQYEMVTFADMDAADTATISILATGGTKIVDLYGGSDRRTSFWGWLVC